MDLHNEIGMVLVDAVIAQVDARIVQTGVIGRVLDGGEADQSVLVEVDLQRVVRRDDGVQPQVPFVAVDQQRIGDVLGDEDRLFERNFFGLESTPRSEKSSFIVCY